MRVRFWGTRGSLPKPGLTTVRYGGNTSCVEVMSDAGARLVLDCGTGAHALGQALAGNGDQPAHGHMLISHTHWDHIQGFPFFKPLFVQGSEWDVYAPLGLGQHLEKTLAGQMQHTYFPVSLKQLGATIRFHDLVEGSFQAGGVQVTTRYLNHPAMTLGYRLEADGGTLVYATDHEPHSPRHASGVEDVAGLVRGDIAVHQEDRRHAEFIAGADVLIHDSQYTAAEYPDKLGWGHSTVEYVIDMALAARVGILYLFHHDPSRTDDQVDALLEACRQRAARSGLPLDVRAAAEGESFEVGRRGTASPRKPASRPALATQGTPESRWQAAPPPPDEPARLEALRKLGLLDTPPEERFDRITRLAAQALDVPISAIGLVDAHREWFKSRQGLSILEIPRDTSFCAYAILERDAFSVADAFEDSRFADMPSVAGSPHVRFYAGVALKEPGGHPVGALCVMDTRPRRLSQEELHSLTDLAALAQDALRGKR